MRAETGDTISKTLKWEIKPKLQKYPSKRWGHSGVIYSNKLVIYGGSTGKHKQPIYQINCDTWDCQSYDIKGFPQPRQSHSCCVVKEQMILWGGIRSEKPLNDCIGIKITEDHCIWRQIIGGEKIKARDSHAATVINSRYILLFGGANQDQFFDDFWILDCQLDLWSQVKVISEKVSKRSGCSLTQINGKVYLFGGQAEVNGEDELYNDLYCLTIQGLNPQLNVFLPQLKCQKIISKSPIPKERSNHSVVPYQNRYLVLIGGEGFTKDSKGNKLKNKNGYTIKNPFGDVWFYDTQLNTWQQKQIPNSNIFKPRSGFSAALYKNTIIIFGGMTDLSDPETVKSTDELFTLTLQDQQSKLQEVCHWCKLHFRKVDPVVQQPIKNILLKNNLQFPIRNLFKVSKLIKHPFDAFSLFFQAFSLTKRFQKLSINLIQDKILILQAPNTEFTSKQFENLAYTYEFLNQITPISKYVDLALEQKARETNLSIFATSIKNAATRLGKQVIIINKRRDGIVNYLLINPNNIFTCQENLIGEQKDRVREQQKVIFEIIKQSLKFHGIKIKLLPQQTFVIIISGFYKILPSMTEISTNSEGLIESYCKKTTLNQYVEQLFLRGSRIQVKVNQIPLYFKNFQDLYKNNQDQDQDQEEITYGIFPMKVQICQKIGAIRVFRNGFLVGKYTKKSHPYLQGYVQIPAAQFELNMTRTQVENYRFIEYQIEKQCKLFLQSLRKRTNNIPIEDLQKLVKSQQQQQHQQQQQLKNGQNFQHQ